MQPQYHSNIFSMSILYILYYVVYNCQATYLLKYFLDAGLNLK